VARAIAPRSRRHANLWRLLDGYFETLENSTLADKSVEDYYYFAECFVRWADGSFVPGAHQNLQHNNIGTTRQSLVQTNGRTHQ
jgi:hypothetical protein